MELRRIGKQPALAEHRLLDELKVEAGDGATGLARLAASQDRGHGSGAVPDVTTCESY